MLQKNRLTLLALLAAVQMTGCVAVTGTGPTVDPDAVDAAAKCAPGTSSTADKPCTPDTAKNKDSSKK